MNKAGSTERILPEWVDALEANMLDYMEYYARHLSAMEVIDEKGMQIINSGVPSVLFNYICRARLTEPAEVQSRIEQAVRYFRERDLPFSWWISPSTLPKQLPKLLEQNGLKPSSQFTKAWSCRSGNCRSNPCRKSSRSRRHPMIRS